MISSIFCSSTPNCGLSAKYLMDKIPPFFDEKLHEDTIAY
jgi:hypothetical protein